MNKDKMINELKKDLVYNPYRNTYVIRSENLPFMAERLVKLFANETEGSFYNYPTLIEPIYNGEGGTAVKDYRVVGQDGSFPHGDMKEETAITYDTLLCAAILAGCSLI